MMNQKFWRNVLPLIPFMPLLLASSCLQSNVTIEPAPANLLVLNSNVNVNGLNSEKFTWFDNEAKTRTISLVHNDQPGTKGGFMEQFSYVLPDSSTRTINASTNPYGVRGFGFIVSHLKDAALASGEDDSPIGSPLNNAWRVVWRGSNHALLEYTLNYPRWGKNAAGVATKYNMPVTIHWLIQNGKRYALWSVTFDLSAAPTNAVEADSRAPYGEMEFSGDAADLVSGVAWGDSHHFKSTTAPLTLNSSWDWTALNTGAAYNVLFTPNNAEMGIVGTRVISKQDAGGYEGSDGLRGNTSTGHSCVGEQHTMPCLFQWSYQSVNYSFAGNNDSTNNKRFAWGADWGYLGQTTYTPMNNNYAATPGSLPKRSYSTWIVLDPRSASSSPTRDLSDQAKTIDDTVFTVTGAANKKLSGAKGIGDITLETYSPAGFNPVYSTWEADLTGAGVVGLNWQVPAGQSLVGSSIVLNNYTKANSPTNLKLNGTALVANQDYFASVIPATNQLWITLKNNLSNSASLTVTP
jgi:hypothetical protein